MIGSGLWENNAGLVFSLFSLGKFSTLRAQPPKPQDTLHNQLQQQPTPDVCAVTAIFSVFVALSCTSFLSPFTFLSLASPFFLSLYLSFLFYCFFLFSLYFPITSFSFLFICFFSFLFFSVSLPFGLPSLSSSLPFFFGAPQRQEENKRERKLNLRNEDS